MVDFYAGMQQIATNLLTQFKQGDQSLISVVKGSGPAYNPGASVPTPTTLPGATAKGVSSQFIMRGLANEGDLEVTSSVIAGLTIDQTTDKMTIDGVTYKIIKFIKIPPAGTPVVWKFIVRK